MNPRTPLRYPNAYFSNRTTIAPSGIGVFGLYAGLELAVFVLLTNHLFARVGMRPLDELGVVDAVIATQLHWVLFGFLIAWLVVAAIMHFTTAGASSSGTYTDALAVAGWASAPEIVFVGPETWYIWTRLSAPDAASLDLLHSELSRPGAYSSTEPVLLLLLLVTTVWSVYILAQGIAATHDVSSRTAAVPALLVGTGSILLALV